MLQPNYDIPILPPRDDLETLEVFRALSFANRSLAELKGRAAVIPNQGILIDTLSLQEARASSEIENIVTTQDELFQVDFASGLHASPAAKEVSLYRDALRLGYERMRVQDYLITNNTLVEMFRMLKGREDAFRATPGTALKNDQTGKLVYIPPQDKRAIEKHMTALEMFVNADEQSNLDPLIKMALIHHQFESIHPFPDGNGRIGRILNVLYLVRSGLLDTPILYLSRHIIQTKSEYYRLLQAVRDDGAWEEWVIYILQAVAETASLTLELVEAIRDQMTTMKQRMRSEHPKFYTQDLLNNLFRHPYTRIEYVMADLNVSRPTATKYLDTLAATGFVEKWAAGRNNYYINTALAGLFMDDGIKRS